LNGDKQLDPVEMRLAIEFQSGFMPVHINSFLQKKSLDLLNIKERMAPGTAGSSFRLRIPHFLSHHS
jgi:hypothetical protein